MKRTITFTLTITLSLLLGLARWQRQQSAAAKAAPPVGYTVNTTAGITCPTIIIGTPTATAQLGINYNSSVAASPLPAGFSYQYSLANGTALPAGLSLDPNSGAITGVPNDSGGTDPRGTLNFEIKAELFDSSNNATGCSVTQARSITVTCPTLTLGTPANGTFNVSYSSSIAASPALSGFFVQYLLAGSAPLPYGLSLNVNTGVITGTPLTSGSFSFDIQVAMYGSYGRYDDCFLPQTLTINLSCGLNNIDRVVTNLNDSGPGSLREALAPNCGGSTITFAPGLSGTLTLRSGGLLIPRSLTIQGPGAQALAISGNHNSRIFTLPNNSSSETTIAGLSLINGNGTGFLINGYGGAIHVEHTGTLTLREVTIAGNTAQNFGGGVSISGSNTVNLIRSTITGNRSFFVGGGIYPGNGQPSVLNISNSTLAGNQAEPGRGGGIGQFINAQVAINLVNSTITGNQGGGLQLITNRTSVNARNSLLALNEGGDVLPNNGVFVSSGYNLFGSGFPSGAVQPTDQVGVNPLLELDGNSKPKLAFNGGPTQTIRPLPGSPLLDQGASPSLSEIQSFGVNNYPNPLAGNYTLTFNGQPTSVLPATAGVGEVAAALNALSTIGGVGGNVVVTRTQSGSYYANFVVVFGGTLAGQDLPLLAGTPMNGLQNLYVDPVSDGGPVSLTTDQRGQARPVDLSEVANANGGNGSDIGAYEYNCAALTLAALPNGTAGVAYNQPLNPSGGSAPYTITQTGGSLPPGLTLGGGSLSGTPTAAGTFNFTLTVTDAYGCSNSQSYTLVFACAGVTVTPASLPNGAIGVAYNQTIGTSPTGAFTFAVTSGALPNGLTLNTASGAITGTPTQAGSFSFVITATSSNCTGTRNYTLTIGCPAIPLPALGNATVGTSYAGSVAASPSGTYTYSLLTGNLPAGLTLNSTTGAVTGTPTTTGTYNFTIKAQAANGCSGQQSYTLVVGCPSLTLAALPVPTLNTPYNQTVTAQPAGGNYSFAVTGGALPAGLMLNPATGVVSGTPTASGAYSFTITATGFGSCTGNRSYTGTLGGGGCPTLTLPASLPGGSTGQLYSQTIAATPAGVYTYALTGSLPPGVTFYAAAGLLYGYPTANGTYNFTITASDANNCTATQQLTLTIGASAARAAVAGDFDGDGKSDWAVWRGLQSEWLVLRSSDQQLSTLLWGAQSAPYNDVTATADYDGDGKMDWAVYRRADGHFYVKCSATGAILDRAPGAGDLPVAADYDGDGKADFAVWQSTTGVWTIQRSRDGATQTLTWGLGTAPYLDVPVVGDYDGDGKADLAVFRRANGTWYVKRSSDGGVVTRTWGVGTDVPVAGDYDGDGKTDLAVWRGAAGNWYVLRSRDNTYQIAQWGAAWAGDVPVPGDYDGDGKADLAVWREPEGKWYVRLSRDNAVLIQAHGQPGDSPAVAPARP